MVSVTLAALAPATSDDGVKVYVAPAGSPLTDRVTAAGKVLAPVAGLTLMVYPAVPPAVAVAEAPGAVTVKSLTTSVRELLVAVRKLLSPL
jgi:hypothetical protein